MKKILFFLASIGFITTSYAFDTKFYAGISAAKIDNHSYTQYILGQNSSIKFDNDVLFAFANSIITPPPNNLKNQQAYLTLGC